MALSPVILENDMKLTQDARSPSVDRPGERTKNLRFTYPGGSRPLEGYTIKRGIGIGGFGEVYFALNDAGKEVALKKIQRNLDIELRGVRQCLNLKHVNLIKLWDIRTNEHGESWVVMEYVPGESLREVIERNSRGMPDELIREWFDATCAGVAYLHDRGIVHRDLKPGNIFRDDDEKVIKIGDYGLSKYISCSNRDGQTESVGTFHYMAPEIGKGVYGKEIDIYALGIILFEMLTGRVPFEGESSQEIIMKHLTAIPDVAGLRSPWAAVIARALAKDPRRRYHAVAELLEDLKNPPARTAQDPSPQGESARRVPPLQTMFIGDEPPVDPGIRFGQVRQVVDAEMSNPGNTVAARMTDLEMVSNGGGLAEEPIARAIHGGWRRTLNWWQQSGLNTPLKIVILVGASLLLLANLAWLLPVSLGLGFLYLIYYVTRSWIVAPRRPAGPRRLSRGERKERLREALRRRPLDDRLTELTGSLVVSGLVCLVLGFFALLALPPEAANSSGRWAWYAWTVITALFGSWALLLTSKSWEHRTGEALPRLFVMVTLGVVTGLVAYLASQFLHLPWFPSTASEEFRLSPFPPETFLEGGGPGILGNVLFFGGLFLVLRWWRQADPVRRTRLSVWSVGLCLVWATLVGQFVHFPLPWSCIVAVMISVATQFAAPWLSSDQRQSIEGLAETRYQI